MIVSSGTTSPEDGFDCDQNTFKITGGIVLGIGGGTSTPTSSVCTQRTVIYGGSGSNGEILNIQSADGTSVLTYQIPRAYSQMTVLFSSPNLTSGGSYTISKGGTVSGGSEFFGLYSGATYSGGTQAATFTASSMVTQVGSTSGGGQPVVEAVDMDLVDGDGKQQFTVEIRSLVDSICDKTGSVLSLFRQSEAMRHEKTA